VNDLDPQRSPWRVVAERASAHDGAEGLSPWWYVPGADLRRSIFVPPMSRLTRQCEELQHGLDFYRLALGQPDQEALVRRMHARMSGADEQHRSELDAWLKEAAISLRPEPIEAVATSGVHPRREEPADAAETDSRRRASP
jgi:hypothetical protein